MGRRSKPEETGPTRAGPSHADGRIAGIRGRGGARESEDRLEEGVCEDSMVAHFFGSDVVIQPG